jgi:hypothetical protein
MEERLGENEWSSSPSDEHREDLEEILSLSARLRSMIRMLPPSPLLQELMEFHQVLHNKIQKARDSYM